MTTPAPCTESPNLLVTFCNGVIQRHKEHWPPEESKLADEFVSFLSLGPLITPEDMRKLSQRLGVEFSMAQLQDGLYGINGAFGDRRSIVLSDEKGLIFSREHTYLHELRELMEYTLHDLGYPTYAESEKEKRAEYFALTARINIVHQITAYFVRELETVQTTWKRVLGFSFVFLFGMFGVATCALLPQMEEALRKSRQKR